MSAAFHLDTSSRLGGQLVSCVLSLSTDGHVLEPLAVLCHEWKVSTRETGATAGLFFKPATEFFQRQIKSDLLQNSGFCQFIYVLVRLTQNSK